MVNSVVLPAMRRCTRAVGFTLIELLVVLAIIALLLTLALPRYFLSIEVAKERVLVENLRTMRDAIDKFYADNGRYPESLDEMVEKKYVRALPYDPIVESDTKWTIVPPAPSDVKGGEPKGNVYDLKSTAPGVARSGKPFPEL
jgi:general secretion pathway protein G